ncbi:MAG TPA: hypothetical protein VH092_22220 [Urbifossiella sp.]|jgi:hypothetical protein|nr:hypothetical protein [Urbifossiella sp.]
MIRVSPTELNLAAALGRLRRRPAPTSGSANPLRFHHLEYDGTHLTFSSTDFRVTLQSRLNVDGAGAPWDCRVPIANFEAFAATAEGGKLTLNPRSHRCVRAEKMSAASDDDHGREFGFAYPLFRHPDPNPYRIAELVGETPPVPLSRVVLRKALAFVAPSQGGGESDSRLDTCTLAAGGDVVAHSGRVFFRSALSPLPFDASLPGPDAARVGAWLALLEGLPAAEVLLSRGQDPLGRTYFQFRTPDAAHTIRVAAAPRAVPYEFVHQVRDEPAAVSGTVAGDQLYKVASFFHQFQGHPVELRFAEAETGWQMSLKTTGDCPPGWGVLALSDCQIPDGRVTRQPLLVSPAHLRHGLVRHRTGRLHLTYRPKSRTITFTDDVPAPRRGPAGNQSFVRVAPVTVLSATSCT